MNSYTDIERQRSIEDLQKRCEKLAKAPPPPRREAEIIQLPLWPEPKRGTPNAFIRSALFPAIQSKDRKWLKEVTLSSQNGITVKFTGEQLNQEDLTIWQSLVHLARSYPLGEECGFTGYSMLKLMGLKDGGDQRKALHSTFVRLRSATVEIKGLRYPYMGGLIDEVVGDDTTKHYFVRLNKKLADLFSHSEWTQIMWEQRLLLRRKPLAQFLHGFYSSHREPYPLKLETLHEISGSRNHQPADFKRRCRDALEELIKVGFLESYSIEGNMVKVKRFYIGLTYSR